MDHHQDANLRVADADVSSGNPVPVSLTSTTVTGTVAVDSELPAVAALADAVANPTTTTVGADNHVFNGTTWDRQRANMDTAALVTHSAASAGVNGADQTNYNGRGVKVVIDITALTGTTPTLTVTVQGKDVASGKYYTLLATTALNAVATTVLDIYPGLTAAANSKGDATLPRTWRVITAIGGTTPAVTATVGASVIV